MSRKETKSGKVAKKTIPEKSRKSSDVIHQIPSNANNTTLNPMLTFEKFVLGPSNSFAHAAALAVAQAPGHAYNPLLIYGRDGLGKTHLMQAIGHRVLQMTAKSVVYVSTETLLSEYVESVQSRTTTKFRNKYRNVDVLLVDDIHFLGGKERLQEEFFNTFNALYDAHKQIVMTSEYPASEIAELEQRLVNRFEWGLVTEIEQPDFDTRMAILRFKQAHAKMPLADDLLTFIATNVKPNVRSLGGALLRALSFTSLNSQPLTMDMMRSLLKDLIDKENQQDLTFDDIQRAVVEHFGILLTDMSGKRQTRAVAQPRQVAIYLCRRLTRATIPEIAQAFGTSHATVLRACKTIRERVAVDQALCDAVRTIARKLGHDAHL